MPNNPPVIPVTQVAAGSRALVVYEARSVANGGGRMMALDPANVGGVPIPAFRPVNAVPAAGTLVGEAILNTTTGLSYVWTINGWVSIVPPAIVTYPTDTDVLNDRPAVGTYAFSQSTGNLFVRFDPGTGAIWRRIGISNYTTEALLLADTAQPDGTMGFAADTSTYWSYQNGAWFPVTMLHQTEAQILAQTLPAGTIAYATDTQVFWVRTGTVWSPLSTQIDTEANILASTPGDGVTAYSTDTNIMWQRIVGRWQPASNIVDTEANIRALGPHRGQVAVALDTGRFFVGDGSNWIGQPWRDYPTQAALLADAPPVSTLAVAIDTGYVFYRAVANWIPVNRFAVPVGNTDPPDATSSQGDLFYNSTQLTAKVYDGANWDPLGGKQGFAIGAIQQSILSSAQFMAALPAAERSDWHLADGGDITGSSLAAVTGVNTVPDLRGAFLRMAGTNASNPAWQGGSLGGYEEDTTRIPRNTALTTGSAGAHTHSLGWYDQEAAGMVQQYGAFNAANPSPQVGHMNKIEDPGDGGNSAEGSANELEMAVSTDGQHTHTITGGGDRETRPKTYSINYFIKIN